MACLSLFLGLVTIVVKKNISMPFLMDDPGVAELKKPLSFGLKFKSS
jgi:hypothetical protein